MYFSESCKEATVASTQASRMDVRTADSLRVGAITAAARCSLAQVKVNSIDHSVVITVSVRCICTKLRFMLIRCRHMPCYTANVRLCVRRSLPGAFGQERSGMQAVPDVDCLCVVHKEAVTAAVRILESYWICKTEVSWGMCASRTLVQLLLNPMMRYSLHRRGWTFK